MTAILIYVLALLVVLLIRERALDRALGENLVQLDKTLSMARDLNAAMKQSRKRT